MDFMIPFFSYVAMGFAFLMIVAGLCCAIKNEMLYHWLKKHNYERWRDLTTAESIFGKVGPGIVNARKGWQYLYSEVDNEDETILRYKDSIKIGIRYMGIFLVAVLVTLGILVVLIVTSRYQ